MNASEDGLEVLYERLELASLTQRKTRGVALLSVQLHREGELEGAPPRATALEGDVLARLRRCVRRIDTVALVGPLRFLILLERAEAGPFAVHVADRIVTSLRRPFQGREGEPLVASVGISILGDDSVEVDEVMRYADAALNAARMGGGSLFGFYSGSMNEAASRRVAIERALVEAFDRNEFELHYQPQLDIQDGTVVGAEALLRWRNGKLGEVSPAEFVPVLEAGGDIDRVGRWVLSQACAQAARWASEGHPLRVGVNVSPVQLRNPEFEALVGEALAESGLPAALLELELTEGSMVDNPVATRRVLESLHQTGVRVAVDDFGTGYASLSYVRRFPMDTLKIDREFVRGLPIDSENVAITSAICALGQSLRLDIVAEGIESEAEEEFLHSLGCRVVQGFRHAKPMAPQDLTRWRQKRPWA